MRKHFATTFKTNYIIKKRVYAMTVAMTVEDRVNPPVESLRSE